MFLWPFRKSLESRLTESCVWIPQAERQQRRGDTVSWKTGMWTGKQEKWWYNVKGKPSHLNVWVQTLRSFMSSLVDISSCRWERMWISLQTKNCSSNWQVDGFRAWSVIFKVTAVRQTSFNSTLIRTVFPPCGTGALPLIRAWSCIIQREENSLEPSVSIYFHNVWSHANCDTWKWKEKVNECLEISAFSQDKSKVMLSCVLGKTL